MPRPTAVSNAWERAGTRFFYWPLAERLFVNAWYSIVAKLDRHGDEPFMNYGYSAADAAPLALDASRERHRYAIQLYDHVAANAALEGKSVLEIGCGRGGGASYLAATHAPRRYVGLDINRTAIAVDHRLYRDQPNLAFVAGDAHALPFADGTFDVALNVESSHHYRDLDAFLREVYRVLMPGGIFLMACFPRQNALPLLRDPLARSNFTCVLEEDIAPGVVRALELDSARREAAVDRLVPPPLRTFAREFAGIRDSELYASLASGKRPYLNFVLRKDA